MEESVEINKGHSPKLTIEKASTGSARDSAQGQRRSKRKLSQTEREEGVWSRDAASVWKKKERKKRGGRGGGEALK